MAREPEPTKVLRPQATGGDAGGVKILVRLAGIEPTTLGFGGQYSIH
jgi:hypothetical protein